MDIIFELVFDLLLDGSKKAAKNKKYSPWIRIPCLLLILLIGVAIIGSLGFAGIYMLIKPTDNTSFIAGILFLILDFILIIRTIKEYKKREKKKY